MLLIACHSSKKSTINDHASDGMLNHEEKPIAEKKILFQFEQSPLLGEVLEKAAKEGKWVYLDIGASWCLPCQLMKRDVYTNKETADFFNEHFITYLVDGEKDEGPDLKLIFDVKSYPTLFFLDAKGRAMLKIENGLTNAALKEMGQSVLIKKQSFKE